MLAMADSADRQWCVCVCNEGVKSHPDPLDTVWHRNKVRAGATIMHNTVADRTGGRLLARSPFIRYRVVRWENVGRQGYHKGVIGCACLCLKKHAVQWRCVRRRKTSTVRCQMGAASGRGRQKKNTIKGTRRGCKLCIVLLNILVQLESDESNWKILWASKSSGSGKML